MSIEYDNTQTQWNLYLKDITSSEFINLINTIYNAIEDLLIKQI